METHEASSHDSSLGRDSRLRGLAARQAATNPANLPALRLAGVPQVDYLAFHADCRLFAPVAGDDLPVQDHMRKARVPGPLQRFAQVRSLVREYGDHLVHIPVAG